MPEWFDRLVGLQEAAATIRTFEIQYVPGLLQTADYTRAVVERGLPNAPASEVQRRVELRMRRAQLLLREDARSCGRSSTSRSCCASSATAP